MLRELEEAEQQARETANIIYELKQRVSQLLSVILYKIFAIPI